MKRLLQLAFVLPVLSIAIATAAEGDQWQTDYAAALETAKKENKPVLIDFTGSDWCGWCIKLDKETFSQQAFKDYAVKNLVLLTLDFPQNKPQSEELKKQNEELAKKYGVQGFPTLVLLNSDGKEIARNVGYLAGGPQGLETWVKSATATN